MLTSWDRCLLIGKKEKEEKEENGTGDVHFDLEPETLTRAPELNR